MKIGEQAGPNGTWEVHLYDDGNLIVRRVEDGLVSLSTDKIASGVVRWPPPPLPSPPIPPDPPPGPVPQRPEGLGVSYYTAITDPDCDLAEWANRRRDVGSRHSRYWCSDAWANGWHESVAPGGIPGSMYQGFQPWLRLGNGHFDLTKVSALWLSRVDEAIEHDHRTGQHPVISLLELYTWSANKSGLLWVPTRDLQPVRKNVQQVQQGEPNDDAWYIERLPTIVREAYEHLMRDLVVLIGARWPTVSVEIGNEYPEKSLHAWVRDTLRSAGWAGRIQINRHEDTPSQYDNMGVGQPIGYRGNPENGGYDALAIHGRDSLAYLDEDYGPEQHKHRTFRAFYDSGDITPGSLVLSTDGVGNNVAPPYYDEDDLVAVTHDALRRGFAVEHQAREIKLGRFKLGRLDLADLNTDLIRRMGAWS